MPPNKRKRKSKEQQEPHDHDDNEEEDLSAGEAIANGIATVVCSCLIGYFLGWPVGIISYLIYLPIVLLGGKVFAYLVLLSFGILFAAFVKFIWRLPVSPEGTHFVDEANAILFPQSSEAKAVARRRSCEVDHLVYACSDLDDGIARIRKLTGVMPAYGGTHPAYGTHNAILSLGNGAYLEIIAPDPRRKDVTSMPTIFGLDQITTTSNSNGDDDYDYDGGLVAFAVHPNPSIKGATLELIAQSMYLAGCKKIGNIQTGERKSPDGRLLQWKFTSPLFSKWTQPFVIDWGWGNNDTNTMRRTSPAQTAPSGCKLLKLVFYCQDEEERVAAAEMHRRIGLIGNDNDGGRVPVVIEESDGPNYMAAEILTPKGRRVFLGQQCDTKVKEN